MEKQYEVYLGILCTVSTLYIFFYVHQKLFQNGNSKYKINKKQNIQYKMKLQKEKIPQGIELFLCHDPGRTKSSENTADAVGHSHLLLLL